MYAAETVVPVEKTRAEIERMLARFKCSQFIVGTDSEARRAMVQFKAQNRIIRFEIQLPDPADKKFTQEPRNTYRRRPDSKIREAIAQAERQRWRALMLVLKAKLEAVESQIATFESEFLAHIVLPDDRTVGQHITPLIEHAYASGMMPTRLLALPGHGET